jgi:hypothetical protein
VLAGVRVGGGWSVEGEIEKPFFSTSSSDEAFWVSYPPAPTTSIEEFERYGIRARFDRSHEADTGWSAHVLWRTRNPGRLNAGFLGGVSGRTFTSRTVRTTTFVSPLIDLPATHPSIAGDDERRTRTAGGFTAGFTILARASRRVTIAPEVRITRGFLEGDPYTVFRLGCRAMWPF